MTLPTDRTTANTAVEHAGDHNTSAGVVNALVTDLALKAPLAGPFAPSTTGATAASRYVGATASGSPATGTFAIGDFVVDRTGKIWVCTTAGTPGTWTQVGGGGGGWTPNVVSLAQTTDFTQAGSQTSFTQLGTINPSITLAAGTRMRVTTSGFISTSAADELDEVRLSIDSGTSFVQLGRTGGNASGINLSTNEVVSGLSLAAHTVKVEYKKGAGGTLYLRAATQPQIEHFRITLEELPT